jgi:transposase-like protein
MIRFFKAFCKPDSNLFSDKELFDAAVRAFRPDRTRCPYCGAALLAPRGRYERYLVSFENGVVVSKRVTVPRFVCKSCGKAHALLPDALIPRSSHSLRFVVAVLLSYFRGEMTVSELCARYGIAVSTLYAWKTRFARQLPLLLGLLKSTAASASDFLSGFLESADLSRRLSDFFRKHSFSFLQNTPPLTTRSLSP